MKNVNKFFEKNFKNMMISIIIVFYVKQIKVAVDVIYLKIVISKTKVCHLFRDTQPQKVNDIIKYSNDI